MATFLAILSVLSLLPLLSSAAPRDILPLRSSLSVDKHQTDVLRSRDGTFSCGFHSIYIIDNAFTFLIWFTNLVNKTVVWTANRGHPVHAWGAAVTLWKGGALVLTDYDGAVVWQAQGDDSAGVQYSQLLDTGNLGGVQYAQLLDTGKLVMKNSSGMVVWQSFDSPTDTLLPTQHISAAIKLTLTMESIRITGIGINSTTLAGLDERGNFFSSDFANQQAIVASDEGHGIKRRLTLDPDGNLRLYSLNNSDGRWSVSWIALSQPCNIHGLCGPNGICHYLPGPTCSCPPGYVMSNPGDWSQGCRAIVDITCAVEQAQPVNKFLRLPDTDFWGSNQLHLIDIFFETCKNICIADCTYKGFQYQQGTGSCFPKAFLFRGQSYAACTMSFYLKLPMSVNISGIPIPQTNVLVSREYHPDCGQTTTMMELDVGKGEAKWFYLYGFAGAIFVLEVLFTAFAWFFVLRWGLGASEIQALEEGYKVMASNFRRYSYKELVKATRKFKDELGRGGSGIVYKGILDDSRAVAVKMLENVRHCEVEFQAELRVIGRINHMNLVRIWGFCSEGSNRMLVIEYIENGSLANILFKDNILLEWKQRFNIALAKLLNRGGSNQNVSRVRGTVGYMAPEWISSLQTTAKVDVYSYGVVLLELVLGRQVLDLAVDADEEVHKVLRELLGSLAHMLDRVQSSSSISEVVDCRLSGHFNDMQVRTLIRLAVSCLDEERNKRPTMESIAQTLLLADESCSMR
ncbi:putative receptor protein kinase ZmPK1 [Dichanthelium oligosanthes]|uniref:Receptor-like serine/threonine-protein kinase n=1 Tax=Dichanthelium oligosanthes TaxID=888268 RepID=A0A1E5V173_9POAL|nr:putative receptor protein kinase ZmPK1 [Dichanthelium oligosanthes]